MKIALLDIRLPVNISLQMWKDLTELKTNMWKRFTAENMRNWIDMLDKLLFEYNNKFHSTIKMTPVEANKQENKIEVLNNQTYMEHTTKKPKFKIGDKVRISRIKALFEKGYLP